MNFKSPWDSSGVSSDILGNFFKDFKHQKNIFKIFIFLLLLSLLSSGIYQVKEGEKSIVLRFGEIVRSGASGLNFAIPGIEKVIIMSVDKSRRIEIGYRLDDKDSGKYSLESTMVTGDESIVKVTSDVVFYIDNLEKYIMNIADPDRTIKSVVESAMREIISRVNTQAILSDGKQDIVEQTKQLAQDILDSYNAGVKIELIQLLTAEPPAQVIDAYREVQRAKADKEKFINEAKAYQNAKMPEARAKAQKILFEAESFKAERIMDAEGKAARYNAILEIFLSNNKTGQDVIESEMMMEARNDLLKNKIKEAILTDAKVIYYTDKPSPILTNVLDEQN